MYCISLHMPVLLTFSLAAATKLKKNRKKNLYKFILIIYSHHLFSKILTHETHTHPPTHTIIVCCCDVKFSLEMLFLLTQNIMQ